MNDENNGLFERIFYKYHKKGKSPSKIGEEEGLSSVTVRNYLRGETCSEDTKELRKKYPDYDEDIPSNEDIQNRTKAFDELKKVIFDESKFKSQ